MAHSGDSDSSVDLLEFSNRIVANNEHRNKTRIRSHDSDDLFQYSLAIETKRKNQKCPADCRKISASRQSQNKPMSSQLESSRSTSAVIDLLSDSDNDNNDQNYGRNDNKSGKIAHLPVARQSRATARAANQNASKESTGSFNTQKSNKIFSKKKPISNNPKPLQAGLVFDEDTDACHHTSSLNTSNTFDDYQMTAQSYIQQQQFLEQGTTTRAILYHDPDFEAIASSIDGANKKSVEKCRCSPAQSAKLSYKQRGNRPYYHCARGKCKFFKWAFNSERVHWYRFGVHNNHTLVADEGFSADDLLQGKVGDCWFLSALAVVAERPDLIMRLFGNRNGLVVNKYGIVEVTLFLDGFWKKVVMDNFLPCIIDDSSEVELQKAIRASLEGEQRYLLPAVATANNARTTLTETSAIDESSSKHDPHALSDKNREVITNTNHFLQQDQGKKNPFHANSRIRDYNGATPLRLNRVVTSNDLAYSKAKKNQLWVPFLEKAYAKSHGCFQAISGGHVAEAFLDLTGAPTLVHNFDSRAFHARTFWSKLLSYRKQRLPMGCGTCTSAAGIIGMHAYSILDVREIRNVGINFFKDKLLTGTMGNVSGFTDFDGTVRLLRIRNPHGKGEWKGEFSDKSDRWKQLLEHKEYRSSDVLGACSSPALQRTMKNDGTFWIDYDNFLMGFSNVDVVLAFMGNHSKSFASNFPAKKSNDRCTRAFEVSLLNEQPGVPSRDTVELYIMGIQKTRRGAYHGRVDRKKSYKVCDLGIIIGENRKCHQRDGGGFEESEGNDVDAPIEFDTVEGQMFGFQRNGHYRLILNRKKNKSLIVMPISFGHPAATDKDLSFVLRFISDAPLLIRELPSVPRLDQVIQKFCLGPNNLDTVSQYGGMKGTGIRKIILDGYVGRQTHEQPLFQVFQIDHLASSGGTVFIYLCFNDELVQRRNKGVDQEDYHASFSIEVNCRGMICRTEEGFLPHKTLSKGKKFEAAWRQCKCEFRGECQSRLLMVIVQSGQDTEMGSISCVRLMPVSDSSYKENNSSKDNFNSVMPDFFAVPSSQVAPVPVDSSSMISKKCKHSDSYVKYGIFNGIRNNFFKNGEPLSPFGPVVGSHNKAGSGILICLDSGNHQGEFDDSELERALALSRGELEIQQALEHSKADVQHQVIIDNDYQSLDCVSFDNGRKASSTIHPTVNKFDQEMERAISEPSGIATIVDAPQGVISSQEQLEKVVQLSLKEASRPSYVPAYATKLVDSAAVVDLVSAELVGEDYSVKRTRHYGVKRNGTTIDSNEIVEIIDGASCSDDDKRETAASSACRQESVSHSNTRRLAAEAAMKRFKHI